MKNPNSEPATCLVCEARTRYNTRTGLLYSHPRPGTTGACAAGGRAVAEPEGGPPVAPPPMPPADPMRRPPRTYTGERDSESVRAVRGGLPGLGRRRR